MKVCSICKKNYYDETLEFCLDDGSRLAKIDDKSNEVLTATSIPTNAEYTQATTVEFNNRPDLQTAKIPATEPEILKTISQKKENLKRNVADTSQKFLEVSPIVVALAHNYWQWLYLYRQSTSQLSVFFTSYNFIVWFLLFLSGLLFGSFSLKYSKNKGFAITSLIILAINLILSIVPK